MCRNELSEKRKPEKVEDEEEEDEQNHNPKLILPFIRSCRKKREQEEEAESEF